MPTKVTSGYLLRGKKDQTVNETWQSSCLAQTENLRLCTRTSSDNTKQSLTQVS